MSRMTRRNVRKARPCTRVSVSRVRSVVILIGMTDEHYLGASTRGVYPRALARQYFWSFPVGTFINYPSAPLWVDPRNRGL